MDKIFNKTIELARAMYPAEFGKNQCRCFHVSALFNKSRLLAVAENKQKTNPRNKFNLISFDIGAKNTCSEMALFLRVKNKFDKLNWRKVVMVNCRIDQRGNIRNSKACPACQNLIKYIGLKYLYHTTESGEFVRQIIY